MSTPHALAKIGQSDGGLFFFLSKPSDLGLFYRVVDKTRMASTIEGGK